MKNAIIYIGMVIIAMGLVGCIAIIKNDGCSKVTADCVATGTTCVEINAIEKMTSEQAKIQGFMAIAERPGLSNPERIALIKAVDKSKISASAKEEILLTMLRNRSYEDAHKKPDKDHDS